MTCSFGILLVCQIGLVDMHNCPNFHKCTSFDRSVRVNRVDPQGNGTIQGLNGVAVNGMIMG